MADAITQTAGTFCSVCREALGSNICRCSRCDTPCHVDCFSYAGGCSVFGCGSSAARFVGVVPFGWTRVAATAARDSTWLLPETVRRSSIGSLGLPEARRMIRQHWSGLSQLEIFSVVGQAWFCFVCMMAATLGVWDIPQLLTASVGITLLSHLHSIACLIAMKVGLRLGDNAAADGKEPSPQTTIKVARFRREAVRRSRTLIRLATTILAGGIYLAPFSTPRWAPLVCACAVGFPWLSLIPRWRVEWPILDAVLAVDTATGRALTAPEPMTPSGPLLVSKGDGVP